MTPIKCSLNTLEEIAEKACQITAEDIIQKLAENTKLTIFPNVSDLVQLGLNTPSVKSQVEENIDDIHQVLTDTFESIDGFGELMRDMHKAIIGDTQHYPVDHESLFGRKAVPDTKNPIDYYSLEIRLFHARYMLAYNFEKENGYHSIWRNPFRDQSLSKPPTFTAKDSLKHPVGILVDEWISRKSAIPITQEKDSKHPVAVLKHPMGSIKNVQFTNGETARLREFATPESIKHAETQMQLFEKSQQQSLIPEVIPLNIAHPADIQSKTKAGAVPHVIRIFFEALMALDPKQTQGNISFTLGDLIKYLYPDGKFNRTNQLPYILNALDILHFYATVPFQQPSGNTGKWRPVVVRNVLDRNAKNEDLIFLDVQMPPDATQGMLVEKQTVRILGKKSAAQFSAYLSACAIWDKHGTVKGKLIDPTRPIVNRDTDGHLVDANGNRLIGSKGKTIKNPYRSDAIAQLEREPNPSRTKYPILSNEDLIKACNLYEFKNQREALRRATEYWTQLEKDGIVSIDQLPNGWRIMPSENHMRAYRAITEAIKKIQEQE